MRSSDTRVANNRRTAGRVPPARRRWRILLWAVDVLLFAFLAVVLQIAIFGGFELTMGPLNIRARTYGNPMVALAALLILRQWLSGTLVGNRRRGPGLIAGIVHRFGPLTVWVLLPSATITTRGRTSAASPLARCSETRGHAPRSRFLSTERTCAVVSVSSSHPALDGGGGKRLVQGAARHGKTGRQPDLRAAPSDMPQPYPGERFPVRKGLS